MSDPTSWRLRDIIDFEYFLGRDEEADDDELERRDRALFGELSARPDDRRALFRQWLEKRRAQTAEADALPGAAYAMAHALALKLLVVLGLLSGALAAAGLLQYEGREPVNVLAYCAVLICSQMVLVALALLLVVTGAHRWLLPELSLLGGLARRVLASLATRMEAQSASRLPASERNRAKAFLGFVGARRMLFGDVLRWPVFLLFQAFGVAFNVGAILATLALVIVSDRAFGWQSAVQFDAATVHRAAELVATPWSWSRPDLVPTLAQVEGTRIVLKEGIAQLRTPDLVSWWPFLCLALAVYGLLPRVVFFISSLVAQGLALRRLDFTYVACDRLLERMTASSLAMNAGPDTGVTHRSAEIVAAPIALERAANGEALPAGAEVVLAPAEISGGDGLRLEIGAGTRSDREQIRRVAGFGWNGDPRVLVLQAAWEPPIAEFLNFIRQLRATLGERARLTIGLVGKPLGDGQREEVREQDFAIWREQVEMLGDPYLRLEKEKR